MKKKFDAGFNFGLNSIMSKFSNRIVNGNSLEILKKKPHLFLIDGTHAPKKLKNSKTIIRGDQKIKCISAASIVAKAYRDLYMIKLGNKFPQYKWHKNFGYGTDQHLGALKKFGITNFHRKSYKPVHNILSR